MLLTSDFANSLRHAQKRGLGFIEEAGGIARHLVLLAIQVVRIVPQRLSRSADQRDLHQTVITDDEMRPVTES